jgi:hypothetical protein
MQPVERELIILIWALYSIDCIHWVKPGETALVRTLGGRWNPHPCREDSFTLLGRMPIFANPVDLRPSFVVLPATDTDTASAARAIARTVRFVSRLQNRILWTIATAYLAAINLLLVIPSLLALGWFGYLWRAPVALLAVTHVCLVTDVFFLSRRVRRTQPSHFWPEFIALLLNPAAALRAADLATRFGASTMTPRIR